MIEIAGIGPQIGSTIIAGAFLLANSLLTIVLMRAFRNGRKGEGDS